MDNYNSINGESVQTSGYIQTLPDFKKITSAEPKFSWNEIENAYLKVLKAETPNYDLDLIIVFKQELGLMPKTVGEK